MAVAKLLLLAAFALAALEATYIESVAANVDGGSSSAAEKTKERRHEHFVPLVAFQCGYRNKFINKEGEWQDDPSAAASCLQGKYDILKYCKRVYPKEEITNIVEYSHMSHVEKWCKEDGTNCKHQFTVRPYRCIVGEFVTESLQVPSRCQFSHVAGKNKCNDYEYWNHKAKSECGLKVEEGTNQSMKLRSFAILEPCGLSMFRGVEYVCCPKSVEDKIEKVVDLEKDVDEDDYDDDDDDSEEDGTKSTSETSKDKHEQDPYFKEDAGANEHDRFRDAEERLEKKHRKKVTKVITEWSELFERYNKIKEKDPKGAEEYKREMTARFRKTVASLEEENKEQRAQIEEVHDERVQSGLNEKKRQATHEYRAALAVQVGTANKNNVLRTLKNYIKAEEKDRTHMLNRYRHLLRSDPEAAISFEPVLLHRLRYIDLRINGTLAMLRDFPELEKEIRPIAVTFWNDYRRDNTPEVTDDESTRLGGDEKNERLIRLYKQTYEQNHPGVQLAFLDPKTTSTKKPPAVKEEEKELHHHMVALKEVLSGKNSEDSDEDQFEEDEDSNSLGSSSSDASKAPKLDKKKTEIKFKPLPPNTESKPTAKTLTLDKITPKSSTSSKVEDDNDADDEEDEEEDSKYDEKSKADGGKKDDTIRERELSVSIEPIVKAPIRIHEEIDESPAYARHDMLVAENEYPPQTGSGLSGWTERTNLAFGLLGCAFLVLIVGALVKRRSRHPGFIEVDVCTPEERHVNGMQVNGYENPTYSFYDSKP